MRSSILKTGLVLAISTIALCSFTNRNIKNPPETINKTSLSDEDDYTKVYNFIDSKICTAIEKAAPKKNVKAMSFSRCPSGINSEITNDDKVSSDDIVYGTINDWIGCSRKYVCDFKVCVNKQIAMVKDKNDTEYVLVQDWLKRKNIKIKS